MILMDRENLFARGWSHVLSSDDDVAELEAFRRQVGAPPAALQLGNARWPHLDLCREPRLRALHDPSVKVFDRSADLVRHMRAVREARAPR
jgi:hypothetical protein